MPTFCSEGYIEIDTTNVLVLVLYVCGVSIVLLVFAIKSCINFLRKKRLKQNTVKIANLPIKKANKHGKKQKATADAEAEQSLAIKRLLFQQKNKGDEVVNVSGLKKRRTKTGRIQQPWETNAKSIKFKTRVGAGNFGEVWMATWMNSTVAVKTVVRNMANNKEFVEKFLEEIKLMSELNHPNIVMFLGAAIEPPDICLILEFCVHGNLIEFLQNAKDKDVTVSMHLVLKMALDVARGIKYLHEKVKIIQRDIKGRNVLVDENLNCKIADFGLSRLKEKEDAGLTACGTPAWTAPEVVRMEEYTDKVDVYSFGVVMWEIFNRQEPYQGEGGIQIAYAAAEQGLRPPIPDHMPERYAELMAECWADSAHERPSLSEILERLFQMMKDESNPFRAAEFYFGHRYFDNRTFAGLLNQIDLAEGLFKEDFQAIQEEQRRIETEEKQAAEGSLVRRRRSSFERKSFIRGLQLSPEVAQKLSSSMKESKRLTTGSLINEKRFSIALSVDHDDKNSSDTVGIVAAATAVAARRASRASATVVPVNSKGYDDDIEVHNTNEAGSGSEDEAEEKDETESKEDTRAIRVVDQSKAENEAPAQLGEQGLGIPATPLHGK